MLLYVIAGVLYIQFFHESLISNEWEHVNGFTRIIVPDTFLYKSIIDFDNIFLSLGLSGVKNSAGPSFLWILAGFDWYFIYFINILFFMFIVFYMEKLAKQYRLDKSKAQLAIIAFLLLPTNFYYSIGALKELPTALFLLACVYHFNAKQIKAFVLFSILLILFRYQMLLILILYAIGSKFHKNQLWFTALFLLIISAFYPALTTFDLTASSATEIFREEFGQSGSLGGIFEKIRNEMYGVAIIGVIVRVIQSLFEPFITLLGSFSFYESGSLSIYAVTHFISLLIFTPYLFGFLNLLRINLTRTNAASLEVQSVYSLLLVSHIFIGGFSFIHQRYLVPLFPLIIIASLMPRTRLEMAKNTLQRMRLVSVKNFHN